MNAYHTIETPRSVMGAIAMIRVVHPDPSAIGLIDPAMGSVRLGEVFGIDQAVIVRWDADSIMLMPHGGVAIVRAISDALAQRGVPIREVLDPVGAYPEAENEIEAWMLYVLSRAMSPLAIDVLIDQHRRWKALGVDRLSDAARVGEVADGQVLDRLIVPPIVAAVGRANVGKSTLINALAGESVALVADVAGTTRDHVGVLVDLGGLVVRWIDTPGIDERVGDGDDGEAIEIALRVVGQADVIVHCIDAGDDCGQLDDRLESVIGAQAQRVAAGMRADRGATKCAVDVTVGFGPDGRLAGVESLVEQIREALVPRKILDDERPWRFWDGVEDEAADGIGDGASR